MPRTLAILKLKKRANDILVFAQHVADSMKNNPDFPSPPRALAKLPGLIEAARRAQVAVLPRTAGTRTKRDAKVADVRLLLEQLRVYVQGLADAAQPKEAARLITSAGMFVKGRIARGKQRLAAKAGKKSGTVDLTAEFAGKVARYFWAYSLDGTTWTEAPPTMKAKTTIHSLTPGRKYLFRARALRRKGIDDWTTPIEFLVV